MLVIILHMLRSTVSLQQYCYVCKIYIGVDGKPNFQAGNKMEIIKR